jgi:hypothetical protein
MIYFRKKQKGSKQKGSAPDYNLSTERDVEGR